MMRNLNTYLVLICMIVLSSCASLTTHPSDYIPDGYYTMPSKSSYYSLQKDSVSKHMLKQKKKVFVLTGNDTLFVSAVDAEQAFKDTINYIFPYSDKESRHLLIDKTFDADIFTTPFKFRPASAGIPPQLATGFNAAFYTGYRFDYYTIKQHRSKAPVQFLKANKVGIGLGAFAGLGSVSIKPEYMRNSIGYEYEAAALNYGLAFLIGYKHFSAGVALGFDHLSDNNRSFWIYQDKAWYGIFVGLNLN